MTSSRPTADRIELRTKHGWGEVAYFAIAGTGRVKLDVKALIGLRDKAIGDDLTAEQAIEFGEGLARMGRRAQENERAAETG